MEPRNGVANGDGSTLEVFTDTQKATETAAPGSFSETLAPEVGTTHTVEDTQEQRINPEPAPEGWLSIKGLSERLRVGPARARQLVEELTEDHPEWSGFMRSKSVPTIHYHPDAVALLTERRATELPPEDWRPKQSIIDVIGGGKKVVDEIIDGYREEHPSWFGEFKDKSGHVREHFDPQLLETIKSDHSSRLLAVPEGWMTATGLCDEVGYSDTRVRQVAKQLAKEHPEWVVPYKLDGGPIVTHYHPELVEKIRENLGVERTPAPEGWMTTYAIATELQIDIGTVEKLAKNHPDLEGAIGSYIGKAKRVVPHYSPELVDHIRQSLSERQPAPEGWMTTDTLAKELGTTHSAVAKIAARLQGERSDWARSYMGKARNLNTHYHPELAELVRTEVTGYEVADDGWLTLERIAKEVGLSGATARKLLEGYREDKPGCFKQLKGKTGRISEHVNQEMVEVLQLTLGERTDPPSGWQTASALSTETGFDHRSLKSIADKYRDEHPDWFALHKDPTGKLVEHYHPELLGQLADIAISRLGVKQEQAARKAKEAELRQDIKDFLTEIEESESVEAQEFRELIELFGAERASDLLYKLRPEYAKLPVPYVKSALAEYLGDFLVVKGEFSLGSMERAIGLLVEPNFKASLTEIVKGDCLRLLNQMSRGDLGAVSIETVTNYLNHIREETSGFSTDDLAEVLNEVEGYYQLLFENVHKPDYFVDELVDGRQFPDINQRINVQEIAFKQRVLIGDEMGTGKSASAVMAKEILGVKQALIVVPSNVVEVWRDYLSDTVSAEGEQMGYFKPGHAPRVLIVEDLETLQNANPNDYDYIVISQERLNEDYTSGLSRFDYGMLIVDEMHKLKNLAYGKRAESLLKLAETIEGDNKYLALLSGTPVPNKIGDIAMSLKLLYPQEFKDISNKELVSQILNGDMLDLRSLLVPCMQMKTLAESVEMPKLQEVEHRFELSAQEKEIYEILIEEDELSASEKMRILRQFILNPQLLDATPGIVGSKIKEVSSALHETFTQKDKVVMFVNGYIEGVMRGENTIFDDLDVPEGVEILTIDGSVDKESRLEIQKQLEQKGRKILLVVSGQTADVGVDFSSAEEVYFYNEPWTEYDKRQQRGRVYRPGLKDDIIIRTFIAAGTIEDGIHRYIEAKYKAVEKLLHGVPISDLEKQMLSQTEEADPDLEVSPELAEYYFSSWDKMMKIYAHVKEIGETDFVKFLSRYDKDYAESYANLVGSRSYQANVARLSGTIIDSSTRSRQQDPKKIRILDVASGPEMLKKHVPEEYTESIVSVDINKNHFSGPGAQRMVGSFITLPVADESVDYANLSLAVHYTNFIPSKNKYERLQLFQELNRVLKVGGRGVVSMIYTLQFQDTPEFRDALYKLGFKVVEDHTGEVSSGGNFKSQAITLEKVRNCTPNTRELAGEIGSQGLQSFKFAKQQTTLRDSRKIVSVFSIGAQVLKARFNIQDSLALEEEIVITKAMEDMKQQYGEIKTIPREVIQRSGFSRIFNGRRYVLFKRLQAGSGAVINR